MAYDSTSRHQTGTRLLGAVLREHREAAGLTVHKLVDQTGLSRDTIISVELGRRMPSLRTLDLLATAYDTTARELLRDVYPWDGGQPPDEPSPGAG